MNEIIKTKLKEICSKYVKEIEELTKDDTDIQVLVLIYGDEFLAQLGIGCTACAVEAAIAFVRLNHEVEHNRNERVH